jgi:mono/diheme cytochrome c family protein
MRPGATLTAGATARRAIASLLAGLALLAASCGTSRRGEPLRGALELTGTKEQRGQIVFMRNCYRCHPGGEAGLGPGLNNKPFPGFLKHLQIRQGFGAMPAFSEKELSDDDLEALLAYLAALKKH